VHHDMFGSIWTWAGQYRRHNTNIGVAWKVIPEKIKLLCGDFAHWDADRSSMPVVEIAARLQNRLAQIHPFANGNGRHARLITDIFFHSCERSLPKWPQIQLEAQGHEIRDRYIAAQKKADEGQHGDLIRFIEGCLKEQK
ncbi:MAG: mobile mystery protein B, partial [Nitrospiraceae bacterium]